MGLYCIKCLYLILLIAQFSVAMLTFGKLFVSRRKGTHSVHVNSKSLSINDRIGICVRELLSIHVICGVREQKIVDSCWRKQFMCPVDCLCTLPVVVFRLSAQAIDNGIKNSRTLTIIESSVFSFPLDGSQQS